MPTAVAERRGAPVLATCGLVLIVVGTFLPWLRSGTVTRNSYQAAGAIRDVLEPGPLAGAALRVWPAVSLACALAVALYLLALRTLAAVLVVLLVAVAAAAAVGTLVSGPYGTVAAAPTGPAVTLAGGAIALAAVTMLLSRSIRRTGTRRRPGRADDDRAAAAGPAAR